MPREQIRVARMSEFDHIRLSTSDLPAAGRQEAIREHYGRMLQRMDFAAAGEIEMSVQAEAWISPEVTLGRSWCSPLRLERTRDLLTDGRDDIMLCRLPAGRALRLATGESFEVGPGDLFLAPLDLRLTLFLPATTSERILMV